MLLILKRVKRRLYLHNAQSGFTKYNTLMPYFAQENENFVTVKAKTLDNLLSENNATDGKWIKIDVEGAEFEVLRGARNIISSSKELNILIEVHSYIDHREKLLQFIESYNLKLKFERTYQENDSMHVVVKKEGKTS